MKKKKKLKKIIKSILLSYKYLKIRNKVFFKSYLSDHLIDFYIETKRDFKECIYVFIKFFNNLIVRTVNLKSKKNKITIKKSLPHELKINQYDRESFHKFNKLETTLLKQNPESRNNSLIKEKEQFVLDSIPPKIALKNSNRFDLYKFMDPKIKLKSLLEFQNDWEFRNNIKSQHNEINGVSIVIPVFNRSHYLSITLASILNQTSKITKEIIIVDDGSSEDILSCIKRFETLLEIKYLRQKDKGYRLSEVRNLGIKAAKFNYIALLDGDMAPEKNWLKEFIDSAKIYKNTIFIGTRKYVDTSELNKVDILQNNFNLDNLTINAAVDVPGRSKNIFGKSIDWRLSHFKLTEDLRFSNQPWKYCCGGNIFFAKEEIIKAGLFDEEFIYWGCEDIEWAYRQYRNGLFFKSILNALAYHQEKEFQDNQTDRSGGHALSKKLLIQKVPLIKKRFSCLKKGELYKTPKVSIYIPAYNAEKTLNRAIDSCLNQTFKDLEVCICDDGSTDSTKLLLEKYYSDNPRVKFICLDKNSGVGMATKYAIDLCKGFFIGQLDSDDYLFPDAVETCLKVFGEDENIGLVYTSFQNKDLLNNQLTNWNVSEFSRKRMLIQMIVHHFRMFTMRSYRLAGGCNENLKSSIDYDLYLKISSISKTIHINKIVYERTIHDNNISRINLSEQNKNKYLSIKNNSDEIIDKGSDEKLDIKEIKNSSLVKINLKNS